MTACAVPRFAVVTPAAGDVLSAIATHQRHHDCPPTFRELGVMLRWPHPRVYVEAVRLKRRGLLTWAAGLKRTLRWSGAPFVVVADKPSVVERCRFCGEPVYECDGYCPRSGKQVR